MVEHAICLPHTKTTQAGSPLQSAQHSSVLLTAPLCFNHQEKLKFCHIPWKSWQQLKPCRAAQRCKCKCDLQTWVAQQVGGLILYCHIRHAHSSCPSPLPSHPKKAYPLKNKIKTNHTPRTLLKQHTKEKTIGYKYVPNQKSKPRNFFPYNPRIAEAGWSTDQKVLQSISKYEIENRVKLTS